MARWSYILLALLLPACVQASLKDFGSSTLALELPGDGRVVVSLGSIPGSCPTLAGEIRATVNGRALALESRGGEVASTAGWTCQAPLLSGTLDATGGDGPDALIELDDGETQMVLLARNAFAERKLAAQPSEDGGGEWAFLWLPETDLDRSATWRLDSATGPRFGQAQVDGERLVLELPEQPLTAGTLRVDGQALAPVERCEGVARCSASVRTTSGEIRLSGGVE